MNKTYLNIKVKGELSEVGVIDIGKVKHLNNENKRRALIRERAEDKIVEALKAHFDCPIKTVFVEVESSLAPVIVKARVLIEALDEDHYEDVVLNETWVY